MTTATLTLSDFLLARIAEDEDPTWELIPYRGEPGCCAPAGWVGHRCLICGTEEFGGTVEAITDMAREHDERIHRRTRVLAECEAKRRIVEWHNAWPVLVETPPEMTKADSLNDMALRLTQRMAWLTQDEYRKRFGSEPPTAPILRLLAQPYADHGEFRDEWRA